jgi:membrane associated rhomboid family serine protease
MSKSGPLTPWAQFRLTRGATIIMVTTVVLSVAFLMCGLETRATILHWTAPTGSSVWREGRVWTLFTGPLIEISFLSLVMQAFVIWSFIPTMEEHWGTSRLLRFALLTSVAGTVGGTLVGLVLSRDVAILGVDPFIYSTIVAFGVLRGKEQVRFFGAATMTGRQMMLGILAFLFLFVVLQQRWEDGGAFAAAVGMAVLLTSRKYNPRVLWKRWQIRRSRAHLSVVPPSKPRKSDERWIN